jgi:Domain of unknown function (DUF4390)
MTVSFTRSCKKSSLLLLLAALAFMLLALPARAEGILVRDAVLAAADEAYYLEANFEIALNPTLEEALNKGVPLYFLLEFEIIRPRWYWLDDRVISTQQQYRLAYNALTRQYRLGIGAFFQNFNDLNEALAFLSRARRRHVLDIGMLSRGTAYAAAVRMRLDVSQLPKPFQLNALASRNWNLSSEWYRWSVKP